MLGKTKVSNQGSRFCVQKMLWLYCSTDVDEKAILDDDVI